MNRTASLNYSRWVNMLSRCNNPQDAGYPGYGGRGIKVCDRWHDLELFDADMGDPPTPEHSIERIDVNGDYEPGNCRWATAQEQARNRRSNVLYDHDGKSHFLMDLAEEKGVSYRTLYARIHCQGMTVEEALAKPTENMGHAMIEVNGVMVSKSQAIKDAGISRYAFYNRLKRGMSVEEALTTSLPIGRPRKKP